MILSGLFVKHITCPIIKNTFLNTIIYISRSYKTRLMSSVRVYDGADFSLGEIRSYFSQLPGKGSVDLELDNESGIALLCLNNPEKKNAIDGKIMNDLESAVNLLKTWDIGKGVLMYGAQNIFCSGGDLDIVEETGHPEGGYKMAKYMNHILEGFKDLPMVTVAFVEGFAIGGGAELAIASDFRVFANNEATMGFAHARMGIIPAWGGLTAAVQALGYRTALDLVTTAKLVRGEEAQRLGLCDAIVGDLTGAKAWLAQRCKFDAGLVHATKTVARHCSKTATDAQQLEIRMFSPLWGGPLQKLAIKQKIKHK